LMKRAGKQAGTRQMIEVLALGKQYGYDLLREAVEVALGSGSHDVCAIQYLLGATPSRGAEVPTIEVGLLERYERPLPLMTDYDQLLSAGAGQ